MDFVGEQGFGSSNEFGGKLLTRQEAAEVLRISPRSLDLIKQRGELPFVRVGRQRICFRSQDLDEYLLRRLERENPQPPSRN